MTIKPLFNYEGSDGSQCDSKKSYAGDIAQNGVVIKQVPCNHPKNLDEYNARQQDVTARSQGDVNAAIRLEKNDAYYRAKWVCEKAESDVKCGDYVNRMGDSPFYKSLEPAQRVQFWQALNKGLTDGKIGEKGLRALTRFSMDFKLEQTNSGVRLVYLGNLDDLKPVSAKFQVQPPSENGYLDYNFGLSLFLGLNAGTLITNDGRRYLYFGPTLGTPGPTATITVGPGNAAPNSQTNAWCFYQWSANSAIGPAIAMGGTGPKNADNFGELGLSIFPGVSGSVSCAIRIR